MELRFVNQKIKMRIVRLLEQDSRQNLSLIARRVGLDVRIVAGYVAEIRREYRFTIVKDRSVSHGSGLLSFAKRDTEARA